MIDQLRSELLKLRTTPTLAVLLLAAAGLTVLGACVEALSPSLAELASKDPQRLSLGAGSSGAVLLATFAGLLAVTSEFRYGTIHPTLLVQPRRSVVLAAKLAAAALAGLLFAVVCVAVSFATGLIVLGARGVDVALTTGDALALILGALACAPLSAMLGVAVGALIRNQTGAIVAVAAYALMVDAALFAAAPSLGRYLPGKAGDALAGRPVDDLLAPGAGAAVLALWVVAFIVAAVVRTERNDV
jgi:ABC-2 type transport system permease protein